MKFRFRSLQIPLLAHSHAQEVSCGLWWLSSYKPELRGCLRDYVAP